MAGDKMRAVLKVGASLDKASVGSTFNKLKAAQGKLTQAIALTKLEQKELRVQMRGMKKASPELAALKSKYDDLGQSIKRDEIALIDLQRQQAKLARAPAAVGPKLSRWGTLGAMAKKTGPAFASMGRAVALTGGIVAGAAVGAAVGLERMASAMDNTIKTSRALGLSTDALQELRYAAEDSGMSAKQFDTAFQRMTRRVGEGSTQAKDAMKVLGLNMAWMRRQTPEKQFAAIAESVKGIQDPGKRLSTLMKLFDSEGAKGMAVMLADGAKGLADMRATARESGAMISNEDLAAAEQFTHEMQRLKSNAFGALAPIAAKLMPLAIDKLKEGVKWIQENRGAIQRFGEQAAERIAQAIEFGGKIVKFTDNLADLAGGWESLTKIVGAFWLAMKVGMLTNPIGAYLFAVGLTIQLLVAHWDDLSAAVQRFWDKVSPTALGKVAKFFGKAYGLNMVLDAINGSKAKPAAVPATQAAGTVPPSAAALQGAWGAAGMTLNQTTNVNASLNEAEARRVHEKAMKDAAARFEAGQNFSPMPAGV